MNAVTEVMDELRKALALVDQLGAARDKAEAELRELQRSTSEALAQAVEWKRERDEANARRDDLRTALEWANEERDRLQRERDEARDEAKELRGILHVAGERLKACSYGLTEFSYQEMASVLFDLPRNTEEPTNG